MFLVANAACVEISLPELCPMEVIDSFTILVALLLSPFIIG